MAARIRSAHPARQHRAFCISGAAAATAIKLEKTMI
jgi:hypothetical protein